jgi:flavin reductase (DIM6/NTAB) family NADH-FMN oxidoreductase RutF
MTEPGAAPIGPIPPGRDAEHYDRLRRRVLWSMPSGLYVVGSRAGREGGAEVNLMTANLVVQVCVDPKLVAVAVEAGSRTAALMEAGGVFTLSLLAVEDRALVRRFVKPVHDVVRGEDAEAVSLSGQPVTRATTGAPILAVARAWLDCEIRQRLPLGSHTLMIGEVVDVGGPEGDDHPSEKADDGNTVEGAAVLAMGDTRMNYGG